MPNLEIRPGNGGIESRARELEPPPFENTILALDVDGVLVRPLAYRQATHLTIAFFAYRLGVDSREFMLDDKNRESGRSMNHFEAEGIHDPWDVSAIIVALMMLKRAGINVSNSEALEMFRANSSPQSHPPDVILEQLRARYGEANNGVLEDIAATLSKTRDPFNNDVTSVFQEYVLGKQTFESTYDKVSRTGAEESLIKTKDQSLLDDSARREIQRISQGGGMVVIYTGRPGLPPFDAIREPADGYAPEAELAVKKSRVNSVGIVSMGSMEWLGRKKNTPVESLTKPNPTQALGAILSALRGRTDVQVLLDAYTWGQTGIAPIEIQPFIGNGKGKLKLVVVEDSPSGVRAFVNAKKILEDQGVLVELTAIGVHDANFEKHTAFARLFQEKGIDASGDHQRTGEGIIQYSYGVRGRETLGD